MQEFLTINKFSDEDSYNNLLYILEKDGIPYQTEVFRERIEPIYLTTLPAEYHVKVAAEQFVRVNELLYKIAAEEISKVDKSYYLFDFSDQELYNILAKPDEWSAFDYQLSQKILADKGKAVDTDFIATLRKARLENLAKPEGKQSNQVILGYLFAMTGGLIGIAIGWNLRTSKRTLPNGEQIFNYQENDRKHGLRIQILGIFMVIFWILFNSIDYIKEAF